MKLPEREFKAGDRVWSIQSGFGTVGDRGCAKYFQLYVNNFSYTRDGRNYIDHLYRSLFTPEEAKELFGVEEEKPKQKVKRWKFLVRTDTSIPVETPAYHKDEKELREYNPREKLVYVERIEESMREFEE